MNLESKIRLLPRDILEIIKNAGNLADELGVSAYLVGGFVRDMLLARKNLDVDIVIEGDGILFAEKLAVVLGAHILRHKRFGTAVLTLPNKIKIDIATARSENYAVPAALPVVKLGAIYDDLFRRDFSINAMAMSINKHNFGKLFDYFNGLKDLKEKKIRILHKLSFMDDPTRLLRAVRFEQRYGFSLEKLTYRLFNEAEKFNMLHKVSKHRVRDEFILMLKEACVLNMLKRLNKLYGLTFIHQDVKLDKNSGAFLKDLDRLIKSFHRRFPKKRALDTSVILFTALLDGLSLEEVRKICYDFALRRGDTKRILSYHEEYEAILKEFLQKKALRASSVYRILEPLSFEAIVLLMAKTSKPDIIKRINEFLGEHNGIKLAVTGEDLKKIGFVPGPHFKEILTSTLHAKIDKVIKNKKDEIKFIKEHGSRH